MEPDAMGDEEEYDDSDGLMDLDELKQLENTPVRYS